MYFQKTLALLVAITASIYANAAQPQLQNEVCAKSPDEAALQFTKLGVTDARSTIPLIRKASLGKYRARMEQIVDDRFSPDSGPFRGRLLGADWTQERLRASTDEQVVGQFFAWGEQNRRTWRISEETVVERKKSFGSGIEVSVEYRIETPSGTSVQRRELAAYPSGECWQLDIPVAGWARLAQLAETLKKSRVEKLTPRQGPSQMHFEVAPGSFVPRDEMKRLPRRDAYDAVWVANLPILNADHVIAAEALWDCDIGLGPEDPAVRIVFSEDGSKLLRDWTSKNIGSMLAVVADEQVLVFARVGAPVGSRLTVCFPGATLERAQTFARELLGVAR